MVLMDTDTAIPTGEHMLDSSSAEDPVEIENHVELDKKKYFSYIKLIIRARQLKLGCSFGPIMMVLSVGFVVVSYLIYYDNSLYVHLSYGLLGLGGFLLGLLVTIFFFSRAQRLVAHMTGHRKHFFSFSKDGEHVQYQTKITDEFITVNFDGKTHRFKWSSIVGTRENKDFVVLIHKEVGMSWCFGTAFVETGIIIGRRSFIKGSMKELWQLLRKKSICDMRISDKDYLNEYYDFVYRGDLWSNWIFRKYPRLLEILYPEYAKNYKKQKNRLL
jgi:hypothetical protein